MTYSLAHALSSELQRGPTINALYAGYPDRYPQYKMVLEQSFKEVGLNVSLTDNVNADPAQIDYIIYNPKGLVQDFSPFVKLKAVFNLQAGIDAVTSNPTLSKSVLLSRMIDPGLREGMVEFIVGHVLRYHLSIDTLWENRRAALWKPLSQPLARERTIGILGIGELGGSCAQALASLNFQVCGWSRSKKNLKGIRCYQGVSSLETVLEKSEILVLLLPSTDDTKGILDKHSLEKCRQGVCIVNAGRGNSIVDDDLLDALNSGKVAGATLDVFESEPLPDEHAYWKHPSVLITPHIAAKSRASSAARVVAENILRAESGKTELLYQVNRDAGY